MKKMICSILAIALLPTFLVSCACEHNWKLISDSSTCEYNGIKTFSCSYCNESKTESSHAKGHSFLKNECVNCDYEFTSVSQYTKKQREKIADEIEANVPFLSDVDQLQNISKLYRLTVADMEEYQAEKERLDKLILDIKNKKGSLIKVYNSETGDFEYAVDEERLAEVEGQLSDLMDLYIPTIELYETLAISIELNAAGALYNVILEELRSDTFSESRLANRILSVMLIYNLTIDNDSPKWEDEAFDLYKFYTGIEIDMSQALS